MRVIVDVRCPEGHVNEVWVDMDDREAPCPECGKTAYREISPVRSVLPVHSSFPGSVMKWERDREKKLAKERADNA